MSKTAIKKMIIELNGKDVELTIAQAKELHAALNELFEEKERVVPYPVYRRPYVWPYRDPFWVSRQGTRFQIDRRETIGTMRCQLKSG